MEVFVVLVIAKKMAFGFLFRQISPSPSLYLEEQRVLTDDGHYFYRRS